MSGNRDGATLEQVAARAGVSRQTVSNALNAPQRLHPDTLDRVRAVIEELGYRPNRNARGLRTRSTGMIGYRMTPRDRGVLTPLMDDFLHALCAAAEARDRHILLFTAPLGEPGLAVYDDLLAQRAVDAFVLAETVVDDPRPGWLAKRGVPFAAFGRTWSPGQAGPWVDVDGAHGMREVVRHLHSLGHRRIGFLGWRQGDGVGDDRLRGWTEECTRLGMSTEDGLVVRGANTIEAGRRGAAVLLDAEEQPTALVAVSDAVALGALALLAERGVPAGSGVAVTGFDDSPLAAATLPGLTSVRQPVERIADQVLSLLDNTSETGSLLRPELVVRASSERR
ncbi:LacI family DNA-binding transcriptional regulator [Allokutzneria oryzae]|uniref:LacI family DNA-binding transcriptional regulator n=1 Tax=Allokutzneria oryzae TaxID=1378989 RepID=A0ABV6A9S7_9PSEU